MKSFCHAILSKLSGLVLMVSAGMFSVACSEDISTDNFAIATEETAMDYFRNNPDRFSMLTTIYERVTLGNDPQASTLASVLSARGNYTIFAPNNEAIQAYMQSVGVTTVDELTYDQAQLIANSCIIDNRNDSPYETPDFPTPGSFAISNLNDRLLTCALEQSADESVYIINGTSPVVNGDIEVSNAMIHEVSTVIAPSAMTLADMINEADNLKVMAHLLQMTTWADSLVADRDAAYDEVEREQTYTQSGVPGTFTIAEHRYYGFTAFVETDQVFADEWGINLVEEDGVVTNWDEVMQIVQRQCEAVYGTEAQGDLANPDNAINRFVAYHLLYGKMAYDRFVMHFNEFNYMYGSDRRNPQTIQMPTNVWDYYTTMGQHRGLLKITQVGDAGFERDLEHSIYINRISLYNDARDGDYSEVGISERGVKIFPDNGANDNNAQNGFYYPIDKVLLYNDNARNGLASERIRIDIATMLPELISNNNRGFEYTLFPTGYFDNITSESSSTNILYLMASWSSGGVTWRDYQGDEFLFTGLYDFVLKLPPVPKSGTYELRMGVSMNSMRGMVQVYFGSDPLRLAPVGLPYDQRLTVNENNVEIPWVADTDDEAVNAENDKMLRNLGYLKGPQYFTVTNGQADTPVRTCSGDNAAIRRIITVENMNAESTYYLRFKSALKKTDSQFFLDYFEFVPTQVYNGPQPEDIW